MAKRKLEIKLIQEGKMAKIYTIHFVDNAESESDSFFESVDYDEYEEEIDTITSLFDRMCNQNGTVERYFKNEGQINDRVYALSVYNKLLRLYCIRINDNVLIVGNGGVKTTRTYQEDPKLHAHVKDLINLDRLLRFFEGKNDVRYIGELIQGLPKILEIK